MSRALAAGLFVASLGCGDPAGVIAELGAADAVRLDELDLVAATAWVVGAVR